MNKRDKDERNTIGRSRISLVKLVDKLMSMPREVKTKENKLKKEKKTL